MSRFGGGRSERRERSGGEGRSSYRGGSRGGERSGGRSYGKGNKGGGSQFTPIGSITTKKGTPDRVVDDLRSDKLGLWWEVYLPKGVDSITLKRGQRVYIGLGSFSDKAPNFVVGSVSLPPEEDDRGSRRGRDDEDSDQD